MNIKVSINALIPYVLQLKKRWPRLYFSLVNIGKRFFGKTLGVYPRPLANEIGAVSAVLKSAQWNMAYGKGLAHEKLETAFAAYIGVEYAIAVNTGGMALQMAIRALGLKPGDEVVHQVDTCSATALAVMNAGCTPIFTDVLQGTFMLAYDDLQYNIKPSTKAVIATHMWGNPENPEIIESLKRNHGLPVIEDACLALGTRTQGKMAGSRGEIGVFSFGCLKPIQAGEGGMIVTNNLSLARELRAMRNWGDRDIEFGIRDTTGLAWNGRMSEIVAAVVAEQLKGYPAHLESLRDAVEKFYEFIKQIDGIKLVIGTATNIREPSYTQIVLQIDELKLGRPKKEIIDALYRSGIQVWHANFELIPSLSFFKNDHWKDWILRGNIEKIQLNYRQQFPQASHIFSSTGLGIGKMNFLSPNNLRHLMQELEAVISENRS